MLACLLAASLVPVATPDAAVVEVERLDPTVHPQGGYTPGSARFSPDGAFLCFNADAVTDEARELYCSPMRPPQPGQRVSAVLLADSSTELLDFHADGERVIFAGPDLGTDIVALFVAPMDASQPPVRLSAPLPGGHVIESTPQYVPATQRVVYLHGTDTGQIRRLRSAGFSGPGSDVPLDTGLPAGAIVTHFVVTPDGQQVLFVAYDIVLERFELYVSPITGGAAQQLSGPTAGQGLTGRVQLSPDGEHAIYVARALDPEVPELYSVPVAGGAVHRLSTPGQAVRPGPTVLADGSGILYLSIKIDPDTSTPLVDIYRAPVRGELQAQLVHADVPYSLSEFDNDFRMLPALASETLLVSSRWPDVNAAEVLWSMPIDGSGLRVELAAGPFGETPFEYVADVDRAFARDASGLQAMSPDGTTVVPLDATLSVDLDFHRWVPGSGRVLAHHFGASRFDYYVLSPTADTTPVRLTGNRSGSTGGCGVFDATSDGSHALYCDGQVQNLAVGTLRVRRLMRRPISGGTPVVMDSLESLDSQASAYFDDLAPDPAGPDLVVYSARVPEESSGFQLRAARIAVDVFGDGFE